MPETNAIIDLSHFNQNPDFHLAKGDGIVGVIHKATQGLGFSDSAYIAHRDAARAAGLLWGAYHFGTGADGAQQADFFLQKVGADPSVLLILDFEQNTAGPSMTLDGARAFVTRVQSVTGRYPGLYAGSFLKQLLGTSLDPVLAQCWFWLAQYSPTPVVPPNWPTWTMWQYTDGKSGSDPHTVAGIGPCDRDKFNGTEDALRQFWIPKAAATEA
jgi:GH25 family lysozyme M1 (1,4-beta-N-acetylmuramidase)